VSDLAQKSMRDERISQLAAFRVGSEEYVIDIMRIKEIINPIKITPVPGSSDLLEGVINLRGVIIPVVDLRKRFQLPPRDASQRPKYIIVSVFRKNVGIIVDEVLEVLRLPRSLVKPAPQVFSQQDSGMFLGVCQYQDRLLMLLDLKKVLSPVVSELG
jgi:purine-binding chemotaxis protein CheW